MRHKAIRLTHPNVIIVDDTAGAFDAEGNQVVLDEALVSAKQAELEAAIPMKRLRKERDRKLAEVDWVTLKAYSQGVAVPEAYATYQQALRDITDNATSLDDVTWPTKP